MPAGRDGPTDTAPLFGLAPGGVCRARPVTRPAGELLPHRFTLTSTPNATDKPRRVRRGGLFSVALSLSRTRIAPNGGRYPPPRPLESGLSSEARPSERATGQKPVPSAPAIIAPATSPSASMIGGRPPIPKTNSRKRGSEYSPRCFSSFLDESTQSRRGRPSRRRTLGSFAPETSKDAPSPRLSSFGSFLGPADRQGL